MSKPEPILITILRHGAVEGRAHVFRGALDDQLSEQGVSQMRQALLCFPKQKYDAIASSPLRRCHDFSVMLAAQHGWALQVMSEFRELSFGDWEGLTPDEAEAREPEMYREFRSSYGVHAPPNGEALASLRERVARGWQQWIAQDIGANRLLVTHAGVMRALLIELFAFTPAQAFQIALPEAACMRVSWLDGQPPFLLSLN
ncbi:MAG: histidine phosphatase family protein [Nitrosomonadales bacterium]|nr:histidine phosphatase family protein [Nitrosomonadales bacterium]